MKTGQKRCLALLVPVALLGFVLYKTGCYFEANDDRYIASILSGVITGSPDSHTVYVNYLLTLPLSLFYRITSKIPWYGGMLLTFQWLVYASVLCSAYSRCRRWFHLVLVTALTGCFFLAYYYIVGFIQYTSTAAMLASAGYVCFLLHDDEKAGLTFFFVLNLLGFLLRSKAMLMVQPLGFSAVALVMFGKNTQWGRMTKKLLSVAVGLAAIFALGAAGNQIGYRGGEWERYNRFNDMRTTLFDYYGSPDYEEVRDILENYQISENKYKAFCGNMILDWKADAECDKRLESYVVDKGKKEREVRIGEFLREIYALSFADLQWGMECTIIAAWAIFLLWMAIERKWKKLLGGVMFLGGARMGVWGYLVWRGRTPVRVTFPLLACEVLLLLALVWDDCLKTETVRWKKGMLFLAGILFGIVGIFTGMKQSQYIGKDNRGQEIYMEGLRDIMEYCESNPEKRYLIESGSLVYYTGSALDTSIYHPINAVISGGWFSNMPPVQRRLEGYLGEADGFYFLINEYGNQEELPMFVYLVEETGEKPQLVDRWTAPYGGNYVVYYFEGAFPFS